MRFSVLSTVSSLKTRGISVSLPVTRLFSAASRTPPVHSNGKRETDRADPFEVNEKLLRKKQRFSRNPRKDVPRRVELHDLFHKSRNYEKVLSYFKELVVTPSTQAQLKVVDFNVAIKAGIWLGKFEAATEVYDTMCTLGVSPDKGTLDLLIRALTSQGKVERAIQTMELYTVHKLLVDVKSLNAFVDGLCYRGDIEHAREMEKTFASKFNVLGNATTVNLILRGLCQEGRVVEALDEINVRIEKNERPQIVAFNTVLNTLAKAKLQAKAEELWQKMRELGMVPDSRSYLSMMNLYCNDHSIEQFMQIFQEAKASSIVDLYIMTTAAKALCSAGRYEDAYELLNELEALNIKPDRMFLGALARGLQKGGFTDRVEEIERMSLELGSD